jgi:hypothetical protein
VATAKDIRDRRPARDGREDLDRVAVPDAVLGLDHFFVDRAHPDLAAVDAEVLEELVDGELVRNVGLQDVADQAADAPLGLAVQLHQDVHRPIV